MGRKEDRRAIGQALASYRKVKRLSQEEVASRAGINVNFVSRIENGASNVTLDVLIRLARAMGTTVQSAIIAGSGSLEGEKLREEASRALRTMGVAELRVLRRVLQTLKG